MCENGRNRPLIISILPTRACVGSRLSSTLFGIVRESRSDPRANNNADADDTLVIRVRESWC